jgi:hypothetical protein
MRTLDEQDGGEMSNERMIVIVPDTPESLVECMDEYTRRLMSLPWWDFSTRKFLRNWILNCHKKRIRLLDEAKQ